MYWKVSPLFYLKFLNFKFQLSFRQVRLMGNKYQNSNACHEENTFTLSIFG
jgi:hypothetical protein